MTDQESQQFWTKLDCDEIHIDPNNRNYKKITFEQVRASEHLSLCSSSNSQFNSNCFTGVRVYDGSKILAAFLLSNKSIQQYLKAETPSSQLDQSNNQQFSIVELGCGCGLSGISAAEVILTENEHSASKTQYSLTFTDMQPSCLEIARKNIDRVTSNHQCKTDGDEKSSAIHETNFELLRWDKEGVDNFFASTSKQNSKKKQGISLILGAELVYFRVDLRALLSTIKSLLNGGSDSEEEKSQGNSGICLLCHVNRLVGGRQELPRLLRSDEFNLAFRNISMKGALAACEEAKYFDHSMTLSFLDRVDFIAIALNEKDLIRVFGDDDDDERGNENYDRVKNKKDLIGKKNNDGAYDEEETNSENKNKSNDEDDFLATMGSSDLF